MSFQKALLNKLKDLNVTETKVMTADGSLYFEKRDPEGFSVLKDKNIDKVSEGFIIDLKPDLQIAEIFPWLCFGSQDVAFDEVLIRENRITDVLSLGIKVNEFEGIMYHYLEVLDVPEFNLLNSFDSCFLKIDEVRNKNGKIYVHCNAGISRSATIVIGYFMKYSGVSLNEALEFIKSRRPCAKPNPGFMEQLRTYEQTLKE